MILRFGHHFAQFQESSSYNRAVMLKAHTLTYSAAFQCAFLDGKAVDIERVEELTEIPRYAQKEENLPDKEE